MKWNTPMVFLGCKRNADVAQAVNNLKQTSIALLAFEETYGHLPQQKIPADLLAQYSQTDRSDSNYILGQLFVTGETDNEKIFTIRSKIRDLKEADNDFSSPSKTLEAGECHFGYVSNARESNRSSTPVLFTHIIPGTDRFDDTTLHGKAVTSQLDGTVTTSTIRDGKAILKEQSRRHLFTTGEGTIWENTQPKLHYPLPYQIAPKPLTTILGFMVHPWHIAATLSALAALIYLFKRRKNISPEHSK